jgi:hypothetical protein
VKWQICCPPSPSLQWLLFGEIAEQHGEPNALACRSRGSDVLCLAREESHHFLLLRLPADGMIPKEEQHAGGALACVYVATMSLSLNHVSPTRALAFS